MYSSKYVVDVRSPLSSYGINLTFSVLFHHETSGTGLPPLASHLNIQTIDWKVSGYFASPEENEQHSQTHFSLSIFSTDEIE